ncbi:MAG TPA: hypothetical protein VJY39_18725 [Acidisphaera sp.]|nr:hypothetical protein [Acidisphaera sp.]
MSGKPDAVKPGSDGARKADEASRRDDPHGVHPSHESAHHEPTGTPTSDRHDTETAAGRQNQAPRQEKR